MTQFPKYLALLFLALFATASLAAGRPNPFGFAPVIRAELKSWITSAEITLTGLTTQAPVAIAGGQYSVNGGSFRASRGKVANGARIRVRVKSAAAYFKTVQAVLKVGGVKGKFGVRTKANPKLATPDSFGFKTQANVEPHSAVVSEPISPTGLKAAADLEIYGGDYSINGGPFGSAPGEIRPGDTIRLRHVSAWGYSGKTETRLVIGGVAAVFTSVTRPDPGGNPNFQTSLFSGSGQCAACHDGIVDTQGEDVSIVKDWASSIMANTARSPFWRAKVRDEIDRNPVQAEFINEKCTHCHAPMAFTESKRQNSAIEIFDGGFLNPGNPYFDAAMDGVSCTLCHQIQNSPKLGTWAGFSGNFEIDASRTLFGPYDNLTAESMVTQVNFTPQFSPHVGEAKLCGTCHNLKAPFVDEQGRIVSTPDTEFAEITTYSEWEHSRYPADNTPCQSCHMARTEAPIASQPAGLPVRRNFARHAITGTNKLMLDIFNTHGERLGIKANGFADALAKTEATLSSAATITTPVPPTLDERGLTFTLRVNAKAGHKLPSGVFAKRVVLHVTVKDETDNIVFESGRIDADGRVVGVDADTDGTAFEPHHDVITSADQVQVYEAIPKDYRGQVTFSLLRATGFLKDNRILPAGFDKQTAAKELRVVGGADADANFIGGSDDITYSIANLSGSHYRVSAELVHQPLSFAYARDLFASTSQEVSDFAAMYAASPMKSNRITAFDFTVTR